MLTISAHRSLDSAPLSCAAEVWRINLRGPERDIGLRYFLHNILQDSRDISTQE